MTKSILSEYFRRFYKAYLVKPQTLVNFENLRKIIQETSDGNTDGSAIYNSQLGIYYVSKLYSGPGLAYYTSEIALPQSSNTSFIAQLSAAGVNSASNPYPDPYAARRQALLDMNAGKIAKAVIVIAPGNKWTVGSDERNKNGSDSGDPSVSWDADICFDSNGRTNLASIFRDNIYFNFGEESGFTYINKFYNIYLGYLVDTTGTATFRSAISGSGCFTQMYSAAQGFSAGLMNINHANSVLNLKFKELKLQTGVQFNLNDTGIFNLDVDTLYTDDSYFLRLYSARQPANLTKQQRNISIRNMVWGYKMVQGIGPVVQTQNYMLMLFTHTVPVDCNIRINSLTMGGSGQGSILWQPSTQTAMNELNMVVRVDNFTEKLSVVKSTWFIYDYLINLGLKNAVNSNISFSFGNASTDSSLLTSTMGSSGNTNTTFSIHADSFITQNQNGDGFIVCAPSLKGTNSRIMLSGNYSLQGNGPFINESTDYGTTLLNSVNLVHTVADADMLSLNSSVLNKIILKNCIIVTSGSGKPFKNNTAVTKTIATAGVLMNNSADATVNFDGMSPFVNLNLSNYL